MVTKGDVIINHIYEYFYPDTRCPQIGAIAYGGASYTEDNEGAVIKFSCKSGFELRGSRLIKCREGKWSGPAPVCRGM